MRNGKQQDHARQARRWVEVLWILLEHALSLDPTVLSSVDDEARKTVHVLGRIKQGFRLFDLCGFTIPEDEAFRVRGGWLKGGIRWRPHGPERVTVPPELSIDFRASAHMNIALERDVSPRAGLFFTRIAQLAGYFAGDACVEGVGSDESWERAGKIFSRIVIEGIIGGLAGDLGRMNQVLQQRIEPLVRDRVKRTLMRGGVVTAHSKGDRRPRRPSKRLRGLQPEP